MNGNVRNFYDKQEKRNSSRIDKRGLIAISAYQGNSHDLHSKKWYISATLLLYNLSFCGAGKDIRGCARHILGITK